MAEVLEPADRAWRGIGVIPQGGLRLREPYRDFDAELRFDVGAITAAESPDCHAGEVLRGKLRPRDCPAFAGRCTPEHPLGAPMVSAEGACAAYYHFARDRGARSTREST
jgi:hydrogenase expression/formation protein HypD